MTTSFIGGVRDLEDWPFYAGGPTANWYASDPRRLAEFLRVSPERLVVRAARPTPPVRARGVAMRVALDEDWGDVIAAIASLLPARQVGEVSFRTAGTLTGIRCDVRRSRLGTDVEIRGDVVQRRRRLASPGQRVTEHDVQWDSLGWQQGDGRLVITKRRLPPSLPSPEAARQIVEVLSLLGVTPSMNLEVERSGRFHAVRVEPKTGGRDYRFATYVASRELEDMDLAAADLRNIRVRGADLRGRDLTGADFEGSYLRDVDMRGSQLDRARFRRAHLTTTRLDDTTATSVDFAMARLSDSSLSNARFGQMLLFSATVSACAMTRLAVDDLRASHVKVHSTRVDFALLPGAEVTNADLDDVSFVEARLVGARFDGSTLERVRFAGADLTKSSFMTEDEVLREQAIAAWDKHVEHHGEPADGSGMPDPRLPKGSLSAVDFTQASLAEAWFIQARLSACSFLYANVDNLRLRGATLEGGTLTGADWASVWPWRRTATPSPTARSIMRALADVGARVPRIPDAPLRIDVLDADLFASEDVPADDMLEDAIETTLGRLLAGEWEPLLYFGRSIVDSPEMWRYVCIDGDLAVVAEIVEEDESAAPVWNEFMAGLADYESGEARHVEGQERVIIVYSNRRGVATFALDSVPDGPIPIEELDPRLDLNPRSGGAPPPRELFAEIRAALAY